jgi:Tfp pilus assembly protein PilF
MFVSSDGRTFNEPPTVWKPSGPGGGPIFAGSFQSLAGDLIRDGITGVAAHVDEPFLDATIRPQVLFPAYVAGFNLAESFYLAMPFLSWQTVIIGDPLCVPFPRKEVRADAIAKGINTDSGLPGLFTERRLAQLGSSLNLAARLTMLKLEVEQARGERGNTEALLTRATELEPKFVEAHLKLASYYGNRNEPMRAIERFRRVLAIDPNHIGALNDLAYLMAENGQPKEALPLAIRALKLSQQPAVLDTVGWTYHRLGQDSAGIPYVEKALMGAPTHVDILIHAAVMHSALNNKARARTELESALKIDPKAAERADVKALQSGLAPARP